MPVIIGIISVLIPVGSGWFCGLHSNVLSQVVCR